MAQSPDDPGNSTTNEPNGPTAHAPDSAESESAVWDAAKYARHSELIAARIAHTRLLLAAGITDREAIGEALQERGLIPAGISATAFRSHCDRAVAAAREAHPELLMKLAGVGHARRELLDRAEEIYHRALTGKRAMVVDKGIEFVDEDDLGAALAAAKTKARVLGVDTERPMRIEVAEASFDWQALADALGKSVAEVQDAVIAASETAERAEVAADVAN